MSFIFYVFMTFGIAVTLVEVAHAQVKPNVTAVDPKPIEVKARKIYERLTGTKLPADSPMIMQMVSFLNKGDLAGAAQIATANPNFLNITVKIMALEMSTRDETIKTPFNDMAAAFIGVTRDETDARELLTGNFYYIGSGMGVRSSLVSDVLLSNNHYADLESTRQNLATILKRVEGQQIATSSTTSAANPDPAGVLTSRAFMGAHAVAGTNRRLVEYTFREFACVPLSEWADTGASDLRIGRDIDRFPAGEHIKFLTSCKGCHTVMDGFRGAFANWDADSAGSPRNSLVNLKTSNSDGLRTISADANNIVSKMNQNNTVFPAGYVMVNNSWVNNAIRPANTELFGWRGENQAAILGGNGVKSFGTLIADSRRFSQCMAKRVYKSVCRKEIDVVANKGKLKQWADDFEASGYKLKKLFENIAIKPECLD